MADFDPDKYLASKTQPSGGFNPDTYLASKGMSSDKDIGLGKASAIGVEKGALLGLRPVVAGLGAAAGDISGQYQMGKGVSIDQAIDAFKQGRSEANQEQQTAAKQYPKASLATDVGGSLLTLPFLPAKGFSGAVKLGAGLGAAQAAGSANSLKEAGADIAGGAVVGGATYGAAQGVSKLANSSLGQKAKDAVKKVLVGTPSALTGVPDKEIEAYATQYDKVKGIIQESGGNPSVAADIQRENIQSAVKSTKDHLNSQISEALALAPADKNINISPVLDKINAFKNSHINKALNPEAHGQIDDLTSRLLNASQDGKVSIQDLQQIKQFLGDQAASSFNQSPLGFQVGKDAANAAKKGYLEAKNIMDQFGPEEIKNANRQLFQLHNIEDKINKNLVTPGTSDAALYAIGSGANNRNSVALQRLGQLTNQNLVGDLSAMSAARTFNSPGLSPLYNTGKAKFGMAVGGAVGGMVSHSPYGIATGAAIGGALSSPAALKLAIDTGRIPGKVLSAVSEALGVTPSSTQELYHILQSPQAQEIFIKAMNQDNQAAAQPNFSTNIRPSSEFKKGN